MKNSLSLFIVALAVSTTSLSATTFLDPDYSGTTTPPGYTQATANGGTNVFPGDGTQVSSDFSVVGAQAYISGTNNNPGNGTHSYDVTATFTPKYTVGSITNVENDFNIFSLNTLNSSSPLVGISLSVNTYGGGFSAINVSSGIEYSGGAGSTYYLFGNPTGLNNNTYTFNDKLTYTFNPPGPGVMSVPVMLENQGTISKNGVVVFTFDTVGNGNTVNGDTYEPSTNPLTVQAGILSGASTAGFFNSGSVTFSNISVSIPEPSTYALLLGGLGLLVLIARRRAA